MLREVVGFNVLDKKTYMVKVSNGVISAIETDVDCRPNTFICPGGVIDTQVNGYLGYDYSELSFKPEHAEIIARALVKAGTFQQIATVVTRPQKTIVESIDKIVKATHSSRFVARSITGIHVEGNFISRLDGPRGAHDINCVRPASIKEFDEWYEHAMGLLKYITIGAEAEGAIELIKHAVGRGVVVSIGHTGATASQIDAAVEAGATMSTHLGNGVFSKLDRFNNPIWPQLRNKGLTSGVIADLCHVDKDLLWIISRCKDSDHIILVSDLSQCAGMPLGRMMWGNVLVEVVEDGSVRLAGTDYLAGAGSQLLRDVFNFIKSTDYEICDAFKLATVNPARKYDLDIKRMKLEVGKPAEFIAFEKGDDNFKLKSVFFDGECVV
ncbi:MAG TPA: hypothetical protein DCP98_04850 [Sphaerochaeta sp.]|nr:hypothetical protein [Sphaerochaeta sp.]